MGYKTDPDSGLCSVEWKVLDTHVTPTLNMSQTHKVSATMQFSLRRRQPPVQKDAVTEGVYAVTPGVP
jgi:hypothetical protein